MNLFLHTIHSKNLQNPKEFLTYIFSRFLSEIIIISTRLKSGVLFVCHFVKLTCTQCTTLRHTNASHFEEEKIVLPADHPSTCWRILKNSAIFAANFVLYHETAGMYPTVFGTYYRQSLVIRRLVTPVKEEHNIHPWVTLLLFWKKKVYS